MKKVYLLLFGLLPFFALAQANFKTAYVVTTAGDTLKGFIDYKEWSHSPTSVKFSTEPAGSNPQVFTAIAAKGFGVTGVETFVSFSGHISADRNVPPDVSTGIDTSTINASVFLKQLNTGPQVILYECTDDIKTRFFISKKGQLPQELSYHVFIDTTGSGVRETSTFRGQLKVLADTYAPGNEALQKSIDHIRYSESDLMKIVDQLNHTKTVKKVSSDKAMRFFAGGGVNSISTKFAGDNNFSAAANKTVLTPLVSAGVDFFANPAVQQLLFRIEASYWYQSRSFYVNTASDFGSAISERYSLKQSSVTVTPQIMYALFNQVNSKIYLGFGAALNYSAYHNGPHVITYTVSGDQVVEPYGFEKFWFNFPVEASGMFNKHIEINIKYYVTGGYSNYNNFNLKSDILSLGVHFLF